MLEKDKTLHKALGSGGLQVYQRLVDKGYKAYFVGGCVRDYFLDKPSKDIDIASSALPQEVLTLFDKAIPTGITYGTITVMVEGEAFEVTTFRQDVGLSDFRRPETVSFSKTVEEDLGRRDFTINAMALTADGTLVDPFGGLEDLRAGILRAVGNARDRFLEDRLRKMRAVRFMAQLGFDLDQASTQAILEDPSLAGVAPERIKSELDKLLMGPFAAKGLGAMAQMGLLKEALPELVPMVGFLQHHPAHCYDVFGHTLQVVENAPEDLDIRWAALLHDVGKPHSFFMGDDGIGHFYGHDEISKEMANGLMLRLRFSNTQREAICHLVGHHMTRPVIEPKPLRRWLVKVGIERAPALLGLMIADARGTGTPVDMAYYQAIEGAIKEAHEVALPMGRRALNINGHILMAHFEALRERPQRLKPLLAHLVACCAEVPSDNTQEALIGLSQKWLDAQDHAK